MFKGELGWLLEKETRISHSFSSAGASYHFSFLKHRLPCLATMQAAARVNDTVYSGEQNLMFPIFLLGHTRREQRASDYIALFRLHSSETGHLQS